jgi:putative adhesin
MARRLYLSVLASAVLSGCVGNFALNGRATDEWTRTYQLSPGGEVRIGNTNGRIDVEAGDGNTVEVKAERIAKATTDGAAEELLPRIKIEEDIKPDRIDVHTTHLSGIMVGASIEVRYHVRAPKGAKVHVTNTNGIVSVEGLAGDVEAHTTNGGVRASNLTGALDASTTNGGVTADFATVEHDIKLTTTNGGVSIGLPDSAKANVVATCTNGGISVNGVKMEVTEQSRRRVEGKMNGGGVTIELKTTNGGIRIRGRGEHTDS